jgi:hypothetical protein
VADDTRCDVLVDRQVANTLAELIIGGSLASAEITKDEGDRPDEDTAARAAVHKIRAQTASKSPFHDRKGPLTCTYLVAGRDLNPRPLGYENGQAAFNSGQHCARMSGIAGQSTA